MQELLSFLNVHKAKKSVSTLFQIFNLRFQKNENRRLAGKQIFELNKKEYRSQNSPKRSYLDSCFFVNS